MVIKFLKMDVEVEAVLRDIESEPHFGFLWHFIKLYHVQHSILTLDV